MKRLPLADLHIIKNAIASDETKIENGDVRFFFGNKPSVHIMKCGYQISGKVSRRCSDGAKSFARHRSLKFVKKRKCKKPQNLKDTKIIYSELTLLR
jgi:hypothetical protein